MGGNLQREGARLIACLPAALAQDSDPDAGPDTGYSAPARAG
jgi:hypothetical protein